VIDTAKAQMLGGDPADRKEASYWPQYQDKAEDLWADDWTKMCRIMGVVVAAEAIEAGKRALTNALTAYDQETVRAAQRDAVTRFMLQARQVSACPDLAYFVACWQLAFETDEEGESQTAVANEFGLTRAAVSKRVVEIRKAATGNTIARSQKSRSAAKTYQLRQLIVGATRKRIDLTNQEKERLQLWTSTEKS